MNKGNAQIKFKLFKVNIRIDIIIFFSQSINLRSSLKLSDVWIFRKLSSSDNQKKEQSNNQLSTINITHTHTYPRVYIFTWSRLV